MEIKYLLKFGERKYLGSLLKGQLYFTNAETLRKHELEQLIKGQGDKLEGGSMVAFANVHLTNYNDGFDVFKGSEHQIFVHFGPANKLPVFCLFACFEKDCIETDDGKLIINLSSETEEYIRTHFPKADSVAIIQEPHDFIESVRASIGHNCVSDLVKYFNLTGVKSEDKIFNDLDYQMYLMQDTPPKIENKKKTYVFNEKFVYRSLLCKDNYFLLEQEYRFILPDLSIDVPKEFSIDYKGKIEIITLNDFFKES